MTLVPGKRLGPYEILEPAGAGGMGEVYLARDTRLERKVAIKLLPAAFTTDTDRVRRFEREARSASALNHPNIITIYEIGEADGSHYIATEYIEGQTLRQHITHQRVSLREALDIAIQISRALSRAHQAGIIHRDIKPENVMLRPDGYVKVLDFGLVKLVENQSVTVGSEASTIKDNTEPGKVLGTVRYMSPEQARGKKLDARTDIFSLGVMIYEMITGFSPFDGESIADIFAAILHDEPLPLTSYVPDAPEELQLVLNKALKKDSNERYQTMNDLSLDLQNLRDELQVQSRLESSTGKKSTSRWAHRRTYSLTAATQPTVALSGNNAPPRFTSSAEYIVHQVKSHKRVAILLLALFIASTAAFFYLKRGPVLTEQDTILLADFANTTADSIFDGTLKQGLAVQLAQSPFLHLFPDIRVRQTLRLMGRSPDDRVTAEIGQEICQRQGLKALIVGSIAPLGSHYVISLEAVNGRNGEVVAREQSEAESKEKVLKALSQAASHLREKLGESLGSIQKFDAPLEVTTSSLEALKAFSLGLEQTQSGNFLEAIPFYKHAIELDPNFAYAYGTLAVNYNNTRQPRLAAEYAEKAFALRDRMSELEKLRITSFYYAFVTGEIDKGIETVELYKRTYPRDERGPLNLSDRCGMIGQFEKAVVEARQGLALNPNNAVGYWNLADSLTRLNRFSDAKETCQQAVQQRLDTIALHYFLYQIAFAEGDAAGMQQQISWASGRPDEYMALDWQNGASAFAGQWRRAQDFSRRSIDLAARSGTAEVAARYAAEAALRAAVFEDCTQTRASAAESMTYDRNQVSLTRLTLALALCGGAAQAQSLMEDLVKSYPKDTLVNGLWLPAIRAVLELQRNNPTEAIQLLEGPKRYEPAAEFWPQYVRGLAFLSLKSGNLAAAEFQKILDHRGEAALSVLYPLAHLGLARAIALTGDKEKSRKEYQIFFNLWKDADSDHPVLVEAKKESSRLGSGNVARVPVGSLDSKETKQLLPTALSAVYAPPGFLLFSRNETLMAQSFDADRLQLLGEPFPVAEQVGYNVGFGRSSFTVSENGVLAYRGGGNSNQDQLLWFDREGKQIGQLGGADLSFTLCLSRDEKRLAVDRVDNQTGTSDIWLFDVSRGIPSRFTTDPAPDWYPLWSPEGSRIVFTSGREGSPNLYQKNASGIGSEEALLKSDESKVADDWSSDGKFIVYETLNSKTKLDLWLLPMTGDRQPFPFLQTEFNEQQAQFSPDGKWIAYTSDESEAPEVCVRTFPPSGGKWRVSTGGGCQAKWRSDGKELFYIAADKTLMSVEVKTKPTFEAAVPKVLFETRVFLLTTFRNHYVVTGDGQRFLINSRLEETGTPISVVLNWTAQLNR